MNIILYQLDLGSTPYNYVFNLQTVIKLPRYFLLSCDILYIIYIINLLRPNYTQDFVQINNFIFTPL